MICLGCSRDCSKQQIPLQMCLCARVCACLSAEYVKQQLQCVLIALLAFVYVLFFIPYGNNNNSQNVVLHSAHTRQTRERFALSCCVFVQLIARIRARTGTQLELTLSLSPSNSGFLLRSLNFCCLRSVQLLTSRLWVRNRLKRGAARACFQINLIIRTSLVVAALPLRCCCCCTCCCRVCHSQNSIRLNF